MYMCSSNLIFIIITEMASQGVKEKKGIEKEKDEMQLKLEPKPCSSKRQIDKGQNTPSPKRSKQSHGNLRLKLIKDENRYRSVANVDIWKDAKVVQETNEQSEENKLDEMSEETTYDKETEETTNDEESEETTTNDESDEILTHNGKRGIASMDIQQLTRLLRGVTSELTTSQKMKPDKESVTKDNGNKTMIHDGGQTDEMTSNEEGEDETATNDERNDETMTHGEGCHNEIIYTDRLNERCVPEGKRLLNYAIQESDRQPNITRILSKTHFQDVFH